MTYKMTSWRLLPLLGAFLAAASAPASLGAAVTSYWIPGRQPASAGPAGFVANFYEFSLLISGVLAFGAIVYGGIKYVAAAGNPSGQSDGKEWVKSALLGLLLLGGAYLILRTINPELVSLKIAGLPNVSQQQTQTQTTWVSSGCNVASFSGSGFIGTPGSGASTQFFCVSGGGCPNLACNDSCANYAVPNCAR